jgi:putative oxidoreductase
MNPIERAYRLLTHGANHLQSVVLLAVRLIWGWQFFEAGRGKFGDIDKPIGFFTQLGIPLPTLSAYVVATTECVGGLLLMLGLASRLVSIPLAIAMTVAYLTAHREEAFLETAPFPFLLASLIVLAFGPGKISMDHVIDKFFLRRPSA